MALRDRVRAFLQAPTPTPQKGEIAIADTRRGIAFVAGQQRTYNPDDLVGRKGLKIYDEMIHDEQVKACLVLKKCAVVGPGWALEPREKEAGQQQLTDLILEQLREMDGNFSDDLWTILSACEYGFAIAEKIYALEDGIVLRAIKSRAPHDIDFEQDPYGDITSITQRQLTGLKEMPPEKFIHFVHNHGFSNPYGTSDLRAAHRAWWHKRLWVQWWAIWGERYALPTTIGKHPKNPSDDKRDGLLQAMTNLQTNTSMTVEEGWEVEFLESGRQPKEVFETAINRLDLAIAKAMLLPDKSGVTGGATTQGSYAMAETQMDAFDYCLSTLGRRLEDVIQEQLIDELAELIAPGVPSPKFKLLPMSEDNKQQIVTAFNALVTSGVVIPGLEDENHARQLLGFEEVTPEQRQEREQKKLDEQQRQFDQQASLAAMKGKQDGPPNKKEMAERTYTRYPEGSGHVTESGDHAGGKFAPKEGGGAALAKRRRQLLATNQALAEGVVNKEQLPATRFDDVLDTDQVLDAGDWRSNDEAPALEKQRVADALNKRIGPLPKDEQEALTKLWGRREYGTPKEFEGGPIATNPAPYVIKAWADTSGDSSPISLTMQEAVRQEFGVEGAATSHFGTPSIDPVAVRGLRRVMRAQYEETQTFLKSHGIEEVTVFRGVILKDRTVGWRNSLHELQPASSFSTNGRVAELFADHFHQTEGATGSGADPTVFMIAQVPRARVLSTPRSGMGALNEQEVVLLGGPINVREFAPRRGDSTAQRQKQWREGLAEHFGVDLVLPSWVEKAL